MDLLRVCDSGDALEVAQSGTWGLFHEDVAALLQRGLNGGRRLVRLDGDKGHSGAERSQHLVIIPKGLKCAGKTPEKGSSPIEGLPGWIRHSNLLDALALSQGLQVTPEVVACGPADDPDPDGGLPGERDL